MGTNAERTLGQTLAALVVHFVGLFIVTGIIWGLWHTFGKDIWPTASPELSNIGYWKFTGIVVILRLTFNVLFRRAS